MRNFIAAAVSFIVVLAGSAAFAADSHDSQLDEYVEKATPVINRPVNIQGLTGLIIANSAYTQPEGSFTIGMSVLFENSNTPNYSIGQGIVTATFGLTSTMEVGIRGKIVSENLGSSDTRKTGQGDTDLLLKWRFSSEGDSMPALAMGLELMFPTGDSDKNLSEVKFEGIRLMAAAASEKRVEGALIGVYLDAQAVAIDKIHKIGDSSPYSEKYGIFNGGILFGLSDDDHLQAIVEYNQVFKKNFATLYETDYTGVMPGLRYVTTNLNISAGLQFRSPDQPDAKEDQRLIGTISYRF